MNGQVILRDIAIINEDEEPLDNDNNHMFDNDTINKRESVELNFDDEKTPVVSQFKFLQQPDLALSEPDTTPVVETDEKRFTNPLNATNSSDSLRLSDYKYARAPSPLMSDPIFEDEEEETDSGDVEYGGYGKSNKGFADLKT
ncbi:unnamed protein product [Ambrosiozyma monospora]|uniref:Unnamed protein product n=1 Tax=Ambrosiozyma monospora TaxID=43982 RepID=A0ACB5UBT2_AMBMO|nr:unnamed protein product [Ambrosiozyma monospora]